MLKINYHLSVFGTPIMSSPDLGRVCRVCMKTRSLLSIFGCQKSAEDMSKKLKLCSGLPVVKDDGLPAGICTRCHESLSKAMQFRIMCRKSARKFQNLLKGSSKHQKVETISNLLQEDRFDSHYDEPAECDESDSLDDVKLSTIKKECLDSVDLTHFICVDENQTLFPGCEIEEEKVTVCGMCGAVCVDGDSLRRHAAEEHASACELPCYWCGCECRDAPARARHEGKCHLRKPGWHYRCRLCTEKLDTRTEFDLHLETHRTHTGSRISSSDRLYDCPECLYSTSNLEQREAHALRHRGLRPFACELCSFRTDLRTSLATHSLRHASGSYEKGSSLQCPCCEFYASSVNELRSHFRKHEKTHECESCGETFSSKKSLQDHNSKEHRNESMFCRVCGTHFSTEESYHLHFNTCSSQTSANISLTQAASDYNTEGIEWKYFDEVAHSKEKVYKCNECKYKTSVRRYLVSHMHQHMSTTYLTCDTCPFRTRHKRSLRGHVQKHQQPLIYKCELCEHRFATRKQLAEHMATTHGESIEIEYKMKKELNATAGAEDDAQLTNDVMKMYKYCKLQDAPRKYECDSCGYSTRIKRYLVSHMERHGSRDKVHRCTLCTFRTHHRRSLKSHVRNHSQRSADQECTVCHAKFPSRNEVRRHMSATHADEMPYCCEFCGARYFSGGGYYPHMRVCKERKNRAITPSSMKPRRPKRPQGSVPLFICEICGQALASRGAHKRHTERHAGVHRQYACTRCPFTSRHSESFRAHALRHDGLKPYACAACAYRTDMKASLAAHEKRHAGRTPHECALCPYRSIYRSNLKKHLSKHTQIRQYKCDECDKSYFNNQALVDHVSCKHKGVKPYCCSYCSVLFSSRKGLRRHTRKFHPGVTLPSPRRRLDPIVAES